MKKILLTTLEYPPQIGGISTYVHQIAKILDKDKVVVYAPLNKNSKNWDEKTNYKVMRFKPYWPIFIWPRWLRMFFQFKKIIKKEKIELIIVNHVLPVGYVAYLIKKLIKTPYLIFSHGTDILFGTRSKWKIKMMKKVVGESEQIIFNSESLKQRFLRVLPEFESKSLVVYPCPDDDFLIKSSTEEILELKKQYALEGKKVILSVSRLDEGKGFPHLIRILPEILKKTPNLVWIIVGDGPKKEKIFQQIQENFLQNVVRFVGQIPHEELKKFYYLADLFVLLTHPDNGKEEGLGLVFLEASATGLPIVAGKSGGVEEAVMHKETGMVFDIHQNPEQIIESIVELLNNPILSKEIGEKGKERIKNIFQWEEQVKKLNEWLITDNI